MRQIADFFGVSVEELCGDGDLVETRLSRLEAELAALRAENAALKDALRVGLAPSAPDSLSSALKKRRAK